MLNRRRNLPYVIGAHKTASKPFRAFPAPQRALGPLASKGCGTRRCCVHGVSALGNIKELESYWRHHEVR